MASDGNTVLVGGGGDAGGTGAVWVFTRSGGVWAQQGGKFAPTGAVGTSGFGSALSMTGNGTTAIVGGLGDDNSAGAAWVFNRVQFAITDISDVVADQGGSVMVQWNRLPNDSVGSQMQVTSYSVWRRLENASVPARNAVAFREGNSDASVNTMNGYELLTSLPATQSPSYAAVVGTLGDSSSGGIPLFTYVVRAHTGNPSIYYESRPDSGYSVDNLKPGTPTGLNASFQPGPLITLDWDDSPDPDLDSFIVYHIVEFHRYGDSPRLLRVIL
jgi:hypothetical protein